MPKKKYVAFIDILGFKDMVKRLPQTEAAGVITKFSQIIYDAWKNLGLQNNSDIKGFIVSDCAIVHSSDDEPNHLNNMLKLLTSIFVNAIFSQGLMLRASITKGNFDDISAASFENLGKRLIVGQAYVDATVLESKFKGSQIVFAQDVRDDIQEISDPFYAVSELPELKDDMGGPSSKYYTMRWANIDDFRKEENMRRFISLANQSGWLSHYYETIYLFIKDVGNALESEVFSEIWKHISRLDDHYKKSRDAFISNAFSRDVNSSMRKRVAKFLRNRVDASCST